MAEFHSIEKGDILASKAEAITNTVNTVGVMGKGIALQFKEAHPKNFKIYKRLCDSGEFAIGQVLVTETEALEGPKYIVNFPTKAHWRGKSKLAYIESGLQDLKSKIATYGIRSIAIPPLGSGHGGLDWQEVRPKIIEALKGIDELTVYLYEPSDILYEKKRKRDKPLVMTDFRYATLSLMLVYKRMDFEMTLLEAQKLIYFYARVSGHGIVKSFNANQYGPYSHEAFHSLSGMDGHLIHGMKYNSAKKFDYLSLVEGAEKKAEEFRRKRIREIGKKEEFAKTEEAVTETAALIEGFEFPFGMELLATVDYVVKNESIQEGDLDRVVERVHNWADRPDWSERKRRLMKPEFIETAYNRLLEFKERLYEASSSAPSKPHDSQASP